MEFVGLARILCTISERCEVCAQDYEVVDVLEGFSYFLGHFSMSRGKNLRVFYSV